MAANETNNSTHQPLTHALEALLGGLGPIPDIAEESTQLKNTPHGCISGTKNLVSDDNSEVRNIRDTDSCSNGPISQSLLDKITLPSVSTKLVKEDSINEKTEILAKYIPEEITEIGEAKIKPANCNDTTEDTVHNATLDGKEPSNESGIGDSAITPSGLTESENPKIPGLFLCGINIPNCKASQDKPPQNGVTSENGTSAVINKISSPLNSSEKFQIPKNSNGAENLDNILVDKKELEWENDSSPIEDSTDDGGSSRQSSSDDSDDGEDSYKLLSAEEQAKILMAGDGASDDEGGDKLKSSGGQLRTKNEVPDVIIPKPDVIITQDMPITELGTVQQIVDNIILIQAKISGEYRVLESGSVLCLSDRSVFGVVAETMGPVQQPLYSVMFSTAADIVAAGLSIGVRIFYSENHSTYVFTKTLKAFKGSDASNMNDEEVGDDEVEFSDDEAEADYKRKIKQKRQENRITKTILNENSKRGRNPSQQSHVSAEIKNVKKNSHQDNEDDGPYRPLARPAGYADHVGRTEAPAEKSYTTRKGKQNSSDRNRGRGRNERHGLSSSSGRNRSGKKRRGAGTSAVTRPPYQHDHGTFLDPIVPQNSNLRPQNNGPSQTIPPQFNFPDAQCSFNMPQFEEYNPQQPCAPLWPQVFPPVNPYPPSNPYLNNQNTINWANLAQLLPNGGFINPAFFNTQNRPLNPENNSNQDMQ